MEPNKEKHDQSEDEEDYILLDLDDVCAQSDIDIPPNARYVLSGLDTMNPILIIDDRLKLIGEYQETIGTCFVFSEIGNAPMVMHEETGPSEANLFKGCMIGSNQEPTKQVKPVASLQKILKFRMATNYDIKK